VVNQSFEKTELMTLAEFVRLYDAEGPFEFIDGERQILSPTVAGHGNKAKKIYDALLVHDPNEALGTVYSELPFVLLYSSDWVKGSRTPDVMYFRAERIAAYKDANPDWEEKPFVIVPDLVIEVISANDLYSDVDAKVDRYLEDGVQTVWVVDQKRKVLKVQRQDFSKTLHLDDVLTGEEIIPGFAIVVKTIFS
jgi:Uma2 family endonuclease